MDHMFDPTRWGIPGTPRIVTLRGSTRGYCLKTVSLLFSNSSMLWWDSVAVFCKFSTPTFNFTTHGQCFIEWRQDRVAQQQRGKGGKAFEKEIQLWQISYILLFICRKILRWPYFFQDRMQCAKLPLKYTANPPNMLPRTSKIFPNLSRDTTKKPLGDYFKSVIEPSLILNDRKAPRRGPKWRE